MACPAGTHIPETEEKKGLTQALPAAACCHQEPSQRKLISPWALEQTGDHPSDTYTSTATVRVCDVLEDAILKDRVIQQTPHGGESSPQTPLRALQSRKCTKHRKWTQYEQGRGPSRAPSQSAPNTPSALLSLSNHKPLIFCFRCSFRPNDRHVYPAVPVLSSLRTARPPPSARRESSASGRHLKASAAALASISTAGKAVLPHRGTDRR